jgi:hypothetical protein
LRKRPGTGLGIGRARSCGTGCMAMDLRCSRPRGVRRNTSSHFAAAALAGMPHSFTLVSGGRFVSVRCVRVRALVFCLPVCLTVDSSEYLSVFVGVCWVPAIYVRVCLSVRRFSDAMSRTVQWYEAGAAQRVGSGVCVERVEHHGRRFSAKDLEENCLLERRDHALDAHRQLALPNKGCEW